jgi:hypothetical protein
LGLAPWAFRGQDRFLGLTRDPRVTLDLAESTLPPGYLPFEGTAWKDATPTGEIHPVYRALAGRDLVVVAPDRLARFGERVGAARSVHVPVHPTHERNRRHATLRRTVAACRMFGPGTVVMVQAGFPATRLTLRLHREVPDVFVLDMGRALDVFAPDVLARTPWGRLFPVEHSHDPLAPSPASPTAEPSSPPPASPRPPERALEEALRAVAGIPDGVEVRLVPDLSWALRHVGAGPGWVAPAFAPEAIVSSGAELTDTDPQGVLDPEGVAPGTGALVWNPFGVATTLGATLERLGDRPVVVVNPFDGRFEGRFERPTVEVLDLTALGTTLVAVAGPAGIPDAPVDPEEAVRAAEALATLPRIRGRRLGQYNRVVVAARDAGFRPLHPSVAMDPDQATPLWVPVVAPSRVGTVPDDPLGIARPDGRAVRRLRRSRALLNRTLLLPVTGAMEAVSQHEITRLLARLVADR